ncbi:hypothetical protein NCAS_0E00470 [Naumovozyma castellii]|uniref:HIT-type domain-containing protein n=1 Tax=Naumovozyma castellii TaxID=27288 RepID=G0VF52_NAUCA|nr:hypothetical protein NCAS_0E00470 [Naumovozyma castellii CBS 4309]CCC70117.1 hypothetical protein NCAS_0E00470 [Naumovozyma castellii CBS 4309]
MVNSLVEEIDKRTYNPNVYFTSADPQHRTYRPNKVIKNGQTITTNSRSVKRINYSLADMEAKLYNQRPTDVDFGSSTSDSNNKMMLMDKFTQQEIIQSKRRFMELDTENIKDLNEIPNLLSSLTGLNKDKIDSNSVAVSNTGADSSSRSNRHRFEIPKTIHLSYRCTRPPRPKRKNTNRIVALKKTLVTKRTLHTYFDTLDSVTRSIVLNNVYNKRYFKVLPLITICSICGGYDSISSCVRCSNKICSLRCYKLHNETRCIHR